MQSFIRISIFLGFWGLSALSGSCVKRSAPELPPITEVGANTAGVYIDQALWLPNYECDDAPFSYGKQAFYIGYDRIAKRPSITMEQCINSTRTTIIVAAGPFTAPGVYHSRLAVNSYSDAAFSMIALDTVIGDYKASYYTDTLSEATITITHFDTLSPRLILSGTFSGILPNAKNKSKKLVLSQGRFDISD